MRKVLEFLLIIALVILLAGFYLGHRGMKKIELSLKDSLSRQTELQTKNLTDTTKLQESLNAALAEKVKLEDELKKQTQTIESLMSQSQKSLILEEQVKVLNDKFQAAMETCVMRPKPKVITYIPPISTFKKVVKATPPPAPKVVEKVVIKEVIKEVPAPVTPVKEAPVEPQTIVINKIYVQDKESGKTQLLKEDKKLINKKVYPNDLLK